MPNWYRFEKASPNLIDIYVYDFIGDWIDDYWGFGITAKSFLSALKSISSEITTVRVHINSPGGDVYSALAIANALRAERVENHRTVEVIIEGLAASAASVIAMGGYPIQMMDNTLMMIHDPWSRARGNARALRKMADDLDAVRDSIIATYRWHAVASAKDLAQMMADETYLSPDAALQLGLVHEVIPGTPITKTFPARVINALKIPSRFDAITKSLTSPPQTFAIAKADALKKQVFGWASVAVSADGQPVVDAHQHIIEPEELEHAVYQFNLFHRELDEDHTEPVEGQLIESLVVTPEKLAAMGLDAGALPQGWWVGFQLADDAVFAKVLDGQYTMFSIAGTAALVPVE